MSEGDPLIDLHELRPLIYEELRKLAAAKLRHERPSATLQATELVHEAWHRMSAQREFANRAHFFGAAAEAMRRILVDRARRKGALRHGGGWNRVELDESVVDDRMEDDDFLLRVHQVLDQFAEVDPQRAELVKLRCFGGCTVEQAGEFLGISKSTVHRHWSYACAWLCDAMSKIPR